MNKDAEIFADVCAYACAQLTCSLHDPQSKTYRFVRHPGAHHLGDGAAETIAKNEPLLWPAVSPQISRRQENEI